MAGVSAVAAVLLMMASRGRELPSPARSEDCHGLLGLEERKGSVAPVPSANATVRVQHGEPNKNSNERHTDVNRPMFSDQLASFSMNVMSVASCLSIFPSLFPLMSNVQSFYY